ADRTERRSTMENVKIVWKQHGRERESAVSYSPAAAEDYAVFKKKEEDGVSDVRIVPAKP
ncbi:hypothetical protein, partial [Streptomyces goshikiensis]|uniref:hypothetical protein n=2 Tax=Streptomyces goshikiensis TaxID=1942 RepID=UPI0036B3EF2D